MQFHLLMLFTKDIDLIIELVQYSVQGLFRECAQPMRDDFTS